MPFRSAPSDVCVSCRGRSDVYFHSTDEAGDDEKNILRLLATLPVMATWHYKKSLGEAVNQVEIVSILVGVSLSLMFAQKGDGYVADPRSIKSFEQIIDFTCRS
jgi:citrate synthase